MASETSTQIPARTDRDQPFVVWFVAGLVLIVASYITGAKRDSLEGPRFRFVNGNLTPEQQTQMDEQQKRYEHAELYRSIATVLMVASIVYTVFGVVIFLEHGCVVLPFSAAVVFLYLRLLRDSCRFFGNGGGFVQAEVNVQSRRSSFDASLLPLPTSAKPIANRGRVKPWRCWRPSLTRPSIASGAACGDSVARSGAPRPGRTAPAATPRSGGSA